MQQSIPIFRLILACLSLLSFTSAYALELSPSSIEIIEGQTAKISVTDPSGKVKTKPASKSIVKAKYSKGQIQLKAKKPGSTIVTVRDREDSETLEVTVLPAPPMTMAADSSLTIAPGKSAEIELSKAKGKVRVKSSNKAVASASYKKGVVKIKGRKAGTATITIKDRKTVLQTEVTVSSAAAELTVSPTSVTVNVGTSATVSVSNASRKLEIESSDKSIAKVSYSNGTATITGVKAGSAIIKFKDREVSKTVSVKVLSGGSSSGSSYVLLAWNDLGMHCMDGTDFSVFTILPPYNTIHAQLKDRNGKLVSDNIVMTYEAVANSTGHTNTSSSDKTNFWDWVYDLFGAGAVPDNFGVDVGMNLDGLASGTPAPGNKTPSSEPQEMTYNMAYEWFEGEGIPITPFADQIDPGTGQHIKDFYPTVKVVAKDAISGKVLATATTVLPVSDEMTCKDCHASTDSTEPARTAAKPVPDWLFDGDPEKDWKRNILLLHDQKQAANSVFQNALNTTGYAPGLLASSDNSKPVLCTACHASNAYFDKENKTTVMGGIAGIAPFTQALHLKHANVVDPNTLTTLNDSDNRTACYECHPGSKTQCLRGAMGKAVDETGELAMGCQSCHGNMTAVGSPTRQGWYEEPTCESCHNSAAPNRRATTGVDALGQQIVPSDHTFATNADTPVPGLNLYRFSTGHGGFQCEACHGATHAVYPSSHDDDNLQSIALQGHAGPIAECTACHEKVPLTANGGPHGMHTTGPIWVEEHEDANNSGCSYCHGTTSAGTPLSAVKEAKTVDADEYGIKHWEAGYQVSCFSCHNGPDP